MLGIALRRGCLPRAAGDDPAMGAGPDAGVLAVAPVEQVVPALLAGGSVVGDLVGRQSCMLHHLLRHVVEGAGRLAAGYSQLATRMEVRERRSRLYRELVERQVRARET